MNRDCFIEQVATEEILLNVGNCCAECYNELFVKELIFYDMKAFRYLCNPCYDVFSKTLNVDCEPIEEEQSLFR